MRTRASAESTWQIRAMSVALATAKPLAIANILNRSLSLVKRKRQVEAGKPETMKETPAWS